MSFGIRAPGLRLALIDLFRRTQIRENLGPYLSSQWYSRDQLESIQHDGLRAVLGFAGQYVPWYRRLGLTSDGGSENRDVLEVLRALPIVDKSHYRKDRDAFLPEKEPGEPVFTRKTGGSTGDPFVYLVGSKAFSCQWAALFRGWGWAGYRLGDPMVTLGGGSIASAGGRSLAQTAYNKLRRNLPLPAACIDSGILSEYGRRIHAFGPIMVYGYPGALYQMAVHLENEGFPVDGVRSVVTTSEMLYPGQRKILERVFHAPVFDLYGCNEVNLITSECEFHNGLHVAMESSFVEVLDQNGTAVSPGETGRIVATGLHNRAMMFIRYDTGDVGSLERSSCPCGRGLIRITSLEGRSRDLVITPDGKMVHGVAFNELVLKYPWIDRYQVIQVSKQRVVLNVAITSEVGDEELNRLRCQVAQLCGLNVELVVNQPFELTSGLKARVIINRLEGRGGS